MNITQQMEIIILIWIIVVAAVKARLTLPIIRTIATTPLRRASGLFIMTLLLVALTLITFRLITTFDVLPTGNYLQFNNDSYVLTIILSEIFNLIAHNFNHLSRFTILCFVVKLLCTIFITLFDQFTSLIVGAQNLRFEQARELHID